MNEKLQNYFDTVQAPWGQLFYRMVWEQLAAFKNCRVLDFGSGFGLTANHLAENNDLLAIEPDAEMAEKRICQQNYQQIVGGLADLQKLEAESFDLIVCHNVLEYASERQEILAEFARLIKPSGTISIVKHNPAGAIMQKIIFENELDEALSLLDGQTSRQVNLGQLTYYDLENLTEDLAVKTDKTYAIRTFWSLPPNEVKTAADWQEKILKIEMKVAENADYQAISFFHHILLKKELKND